MDMESDVCLLFDIQSSHGLVGFSIKGVIVHRTEAITKNCPQEISSVIGMKFDALTIEQGILIKEYLFRVENGLSID